MNPWADVPMEAHHTEEDAPPVASDDFTDWAKKNVPLAESEGGETD